MDNFISVSLDRLFFLCAGTGVVPSEEKGPGETKNHSARLGGVGLSKRRGSILVRLGWEGRGKDPRGLGEGGIVGGGGGSRI